MLAQVSQIGLHKPIPSAGDCGTETGNIPINDDVRVVDLNGNKAVAFYANGKL